MNIPGEVKVQKPDTRLIRMLCSLRPYVRQCGDVWRAPWFMSDRKLFDYLLVCIISGKGIFSVGEKGFFPVSDGDIILIPPDTLHSMRGTSAKMHLSYIHFDLYFDPQSSFWDAHIPGGVTDLSKFNKKPHPIPNDPLLSRLCGKILSDDKSGIIPQSREICVLHKAYGNSAIIELSAMMLRLIASIINEVENREQNFLHKIRMDNAFKIINSAETLDISIAKIAKEVGFSVSHFRRIFKSVYSISPIKLHRNVLMRKANELIFYQGLNVSEAADRLGFKNMHNFSRAYKNYYGKSPKKKAPNSTPLSKGKKRQQN